MGPKRDNATYNIATGGNNNYDADNTEDYLSTLTTVEILAIIGLPELAAAVVTIVIILVLI